MIKAVLFDFGGVLLRTADQSGRQRWETKLGLPPHGLHDVVFNSEAAKQATAGQVGVEAVWAHVAGALQLDPAALPEFQKDFWSGDVLDAELVQLIKELKPRYKTAILSNAWSDARELFTRLFGASDVFDVFIISSEEKVAKPDPRLFALAVARLGVPPGEAVLVDDFIQNVEGARAAGMQAIHYTLGLDVRAALRDLGVA